MTCSVTLTLTGRSRLMIATKMIVTWYLLVSQLCHDIAPRSAYMTPLAPHVSAACPEKSRDTHDTAYAANGHKTGMRKSLLTIAVKHKTLLAKCHHPA